MGRSLFSKADKSKVTEPKNPVQKKIPLYRMETLNLSQYFVTRKDSIRKSKSKFKRTLDSPTVSSTPEPKSSLISKLENLSTTLASEDNRRSSVSSIDSPFSFRNTSRNAWASKSMRNRLRDDDTSSVISIGESTCFSEEDSMYLETCSLRSELTTSTSINGISTGLALSCPNPSECYKYGPKLRSCRYCRSGPMESTIYLRHLRKINHKANRAKAETCYTEDMHLERETRCITFTGFLRDTPQSGFGSHLFSFGMVDYTFVGMDEDSLEEPTLIVEMDTAEDAMDAIKFSNLHFCGFRLQPRKMETEDGAPSDVWAAQELKRILTSLNASKAESRESIVEQLVQQTEMTSDETENKAIIMSDLEKYLRRSYPAARCQMFGSSVTGLGLFGSGLNIHVNVGQQLFNQQAKGFGVVLEGGLAKQVAEHLDSNTLYKTVNQSTFCRQPTVSFVDVRSRLQVDLFFGDNQVLLSTCLFKLYMSLNPVVKPYLTLIRLWALGNDLMNSKQQFSHISSYALMMMALFFLMRKPGGGPQSKPILPSVNQLMKTGRVKVDAPPSDCGCCSLLTSGHPNVSCSLHPVQLVKEFLKFYSTFKYTSFAICPSTGKMVPKLAFLKQFPSFKTNAIAVQDPFTLNCNLTQNYMAKPLLRFRDLCACGHQNLDDVLTKGDDLFTFFMPSHLTELAESEVSTNPASEEEIRQEMSSLMEELRIDEITRSLNSPKGICL